MPIRCCGQVLCPEIRLIIYSFLVPHSEFSLVRPEAILDRPFSILAPSSLAFTCRGIYDEYIEVFHRSLHVRLSWAKVLDFANLELLCRIRYLEIVDEEHSAQLVNSDGDERIRHDALQVSWSERCAHAGLTLMGMIKKLVVLPSIRTLDIDISRLSKTLEVYHSPHSIRSLLENYLNATLCCTDVGVFAFESSSPLRKVKFKHFDISSIWPLMCESKHSSMEHRRHKNTIPTRRASTLARYLDTFSLIGLPALEWAWFHILPSQHLDVPPHGAILRRPAYAQDDAKRVDIHDITGLNSAPELLEALTDLLDAEIGIARGVYCERCVLVRKMEESGMRCGYGIHQIEAFLEGCGCFLCSRLEYRARVRLL